MRNHRNAVSLSVMLLISTALLPAVAAAEGASQPAGMMRLTILTPQGQPAAGAQVTLLPIRDCWSLVYWGDPQQPAVPHFQQGASDASGVVTLRPTAPTRKIVVLHPSGFLELSAQQAASGATLHLLPWARVAGKLLVGSAVGANQRVVIGRTNLGQDDLSVPYHIEADTDAQGRFAIDHVPPGALSICRLVKTDPNDQPRGWAAEEKRFTVKPGETAEIVLGGTGRAVTGQAIMPASLAARHDWGWDGRCVLSASDPIPDWPMPADIHNGTAEQQAQWKKTFLKTDAGKAYLAAFQAAVHSFRSYAMEMQPGGQFRIDDVPAGQYQLSLGISSSADQQMASGSATITVPAMPSGRSDVALVVPAVAMHLMQVASVGQPAPEFVVPALKGKNLKLSDFKGKYVLLDFWSTWCGPCLEEMPNLRATYEAFAPSGRFVILGLSLDDKAETALEYVRKQRLPWPQGWLGGNDGKRVLEDYPSDGIPHFWLIGPDGKVIADGMRGPGIQAEVAAAMRR